MIEVDRPLEWETCRQVALHASEDGWDVFIAFTPEAGRWMRLLAVGPSCLSERPEAPGADWIEVKATAEPNGKVNLEGVPPGGLKGKVIDLCVPKGMSTQLALRALLEILAGGAAEVTWSSREEDQR